MDWSERRMTALPPPPLLKVAFFRQDRMRGRAGDAAPRVRSKASGSDSKVGHVFDKNGTVATAVTERMKVFQARESGFASGVAEHVS